MGMVRSYPFSAEPTFQEVCGPLRPHFQGTSVLSLPAFAGQGDRTGVLLVKLARCPRHLMRLPLISTSQVRKWKLTELQ